MNFGIHKYHLIFLAATSIFYLIVYNRKFALLVYVIFILPLLFFSRMGTAAVFCVSIIAMLNSHGRNVFITIISGFSILSTLLAYSFISGSFDRLPSYMISIHILKDINLFGLGFKQYTPYIKDNFGILNADMSAYFVEGVNKTVWLSSESMYAEIISTWGVVGFAILFYFLFISMRSVYVYSLARREERLLILMWNFLFISGIAQDMLNITFLFFIILGILVGILTLYSHHFNSPIMTKKLNTLIKYN